MKISIVTLFPELYASFLNTSLVKRAHDQGIITSDLVSLFSFCKPKERADAPTFGHGAGMLLRPEIIERAVDCQEKKHGKAFKIFFSPHGKKLDQHMVKSLISKIYDQHLHVALFPARYEGMDVRIEEEYADEILSIGDYVLMGGDIPAMVFLEVFLRYMPGVIGCNDSVEHDSFSSALVDYPEYTSPIRWKGREVPEVVRSGDHQKIATWHKQKAIERTLSCHFDWLRQHTLSFQERQEVAQHIPSHYAALMHDHVMLPGNKEGCTSVTSLDIHDIARSATTFGLKGYYIVTPLEDQQKIVKKLLDFWQEGAGVTYNVNRHEALEATYLKLSFEEVCNHIQEREGKKPLVIATSARKVASEKIITYYDQGKVWGQNRPILFVFGTGRGLSSAFLEQCDYVLVPVEGFTSFNHLSVRSAAAIIFDRWLGINIKHIVTDEVS